MSIEQVPETAAAHKNAEVLAEDIQSDGVPNELFKAWLEANLKYPQEGIGIVSYVGERMFSPDASFESLHIERLNPEQLNHIVTMMNKAHAAVGVGAFVNRSRENSLEVLEDLWQRVWENALITGAEYVSRAHRGKGIERVNIHTREEYTESCIHFLRDAFIQNPALRTNVYKFFLICIEALETKDVKELEQKRKKLLNYSEKDPKEKHANNLRASGIREEIEAFVFNYVAERDSTAIDVEAFFKLDL